MGPNRRNLDPTQTEVTGKDRDKGRGKDLDRGRGKDEDSHHFFWIGWTCGRGLTHSLSHSLGMGSPPGGHRVSSLPKGLIDAGFE